MIPRSFFLTKGVGKHKEHLASFELALRDAGIQQCNLVTVSSIIPPGCKLIPRERGVQMLHAGEITFVVLARNSTDEPHRLIASSIGIAIPVEEQQYGYLSEHHSFGQTEETAGDYCEDLRLLCWRQLWGSSLILRQHGMRGSNCSSRVALLSRRLT